MSVGRLALRGIVGPLFIGHGAQKLFGKFGGQGLEGTGGFFESQLGLRPGRRHAMAAGVSEAAGGALLTAGALTPIASAALSGTMITAIRKVHAANGPWVAQNGYEYNLVLLAAFFVLSDVGPGKPSVDAARFPNLHGPAFAVLQLAAGAIGSYLATERFSAPAAPAPVEPASAPVEDKEFGGFKTPAEETVTALDVPAS